MGAVICYSLALCLISDLLSPEVSFANLLANYLHGTFSISVPADFSYSRKGEPYDYYGYSEGSKTGFATIELYEKSNYLCSPESLGAYNTSTMEYQSEIFEKDYSGTKGIWTKVPLISGHSRLNDTYCNEFPPDCTGTELLEETCETEYATYAFCSEKEEKRVAICMHQQKDNPELAKEVFESFRWADESGTFSDVSSAHPQSQAISYVKEQGIVEGYSDGTYKPDNQINRAEFTKILIGASNFENDTSANSCFPDVGNEWFASYVCTAKSHNIITGHPDGTFHPGDKINTAEAAKIVVNTFGLSSSETSGEWYETYIASLVDAGALPETAKDPTHLLTRGEMAEVIYRLAQSNK